MSLKDVFEKVNRRQLKHKKITQHAKSETLLLSGPEVIKLFSCSTQLSTKFQLLIKTKMLKNKDVLAFKPSDVLFIKLINVGILTFMSMINFMLS